MVTAVVELGAALAQQPLPIPNPDPSLPAGVAQPMSMFIGWLKAFLLIATWASFLISGIMIAIGIKNRRQASQEGVFGVGWGLLGLTVGGCSYALASVLPV